MNFKKLIIVTAAAGLVSAAAFAANTYRTTGAPIRCEDGLRIRKEGPRSIVRGAQFTYTISVRNFGDCDIRNIRIEDQLPANTQYVSAVPLPSTIPGGSYDGTAIWTGIDLDPGQQRIFTITVLDITPADQVGSATLLNTACAFVGDDHDRGHEHHGVRVCDQAITTSPSPSPEVR